MNPISDLGADELNEFGEKFEAAMERGMNRRS
jgi:hypothetical protein